MKAKSMFLLLAATLLTFSSQAQMADRQLERPVAQGPTATTAEELTREMVNRLRLNEVQYMKLLPVNRTRLARLSTINHQYKKDEATRTAKVAELDAYYQQECSRILTPSQLSQLHGGEQSQPSTAPATAAGNGLG
jgi:hypothetical protein